ncbi:hypothetical protein D3C72_787040 [compost metagenome]
MMSHKLLVSMLAAAAMAGCGSPAALTTSPTNTDTNTALAPEAAFQGERHVLATGATMSFDQIRAQLPQQISEADANRLLTSIDPSKIAEDEAQANFTVQQRGFRGGYGGIGRGFSRGFGGYGRGFGRGFYGGYGRGFRYYNYGRFAFPYYNYGGFYRPYYYNNYYPFLYNYANTCYPYTYRY